MNSHFHLFSDRIQRIEFNIASKHIRKATRTLVSIQRIEFNIASKLYRQSYCKIALYTTY